MLLWAFLSLDKLFCIHQNSNWSQSSAGSHIRTKCARDSLFTDIPHCFVYILKNFHGLLQPHSCTGTSVWLIIFQDIKSSWQWLHTSTEFLFFTYEPIKWTEMYTVCLHLVRSTLQIFSVICQPHYSLLLHFCALSQLCFFFFFPFRSLIKKWSHLRPRTNPWRPQ